MSDSVNSLHLAKATLVKELLWLKNNPLLEYDGNSQQLLQEVQTIQNLKWKTPYPAQPLAYTSQSLPKNQQTPLSRLKMLGLSFKYPFTATDCLAYKRSYSHQPSVLDHVADVAEQVRKDAYIVRRVSELEKQGLLKSRALPKTGPQSESSSHRAALHVEVEQMAEVRVFGFSCCCYVSFSFVFFFLVLLLTK
jgi:hypothetical protein